MTIDLGFAFLELPGNPPLFAGIVDVPGHEKFVKNMLAGAGGVDIALLVIAADDGVMPQTREHLDILTILGITQGVVALTKSDSVDADWLELVKETVQETLQATPLCNAPIISVSSVTGVGIPELKQALAQIARSLPERDARSAFRLPIDRVFSLAGVGTVVTGTLVCGTLRLGDTVEIQPQGLTSKARTLQTHNQRVDEAMPGMRVAVNLPGVEVGALERGAVLAPPGVLKPTTLTDVHVMVLPSAHRPLHHRERVRVHLGAGEVLARLLLLEGSEVPPSSAAVPAQLLWEEAVAPARGERFVLRTYSPLRTIGGGTVLEPVAARKYRRGDATALALFDARGTGETTQAVYAVLAAHHHDFTVAEVANATGLEANLVQVALDSLADEGKVIAFGNGLYMADSTAVRLRETAQKNLAQFHQKSPLKKAMRRENLRAPLSKAATFRDLPALLYWLEREEVLCFEGEVGVRLPEHEVVIPPGWKKPAEEILAVYQSAKFQPPSPDNFQANYPRDVNVRTILTILAENDQLVHISDDIFLSAEAFREIKEVIRQLGASPDGITVATVRDATESSRKVILPLLEYLDSHKFTRRQGDIRVLVTEEIRSQ
jgi:selenocysteine-specific elongation factor